MANPYQRPGFKDPRETAQESASTLSSYFKDKGSKTGGASVYSAPVGDAAGTSPAAGGSAGGPSAPSAPKSSAGGGTGFMSFGQYFGANAPAIQQQAQKQQRSVSSNEHTQHLRAQQQRAQQQRAQQQGASTGSTALARHRQRKHGG